MTIILITVTVVIMIMMIATIMVICAALAMQPSAPRTPQLGGGHMIATSHPRSMVNLAPLQQGCAGSVLRAGCSLYQGHRAWMHPLRGRTQLKPRR